LNCRGHEFANEQNNNGAFKSLEKKTRTSKYTGRKKYTGDTDGSGGGGRRTAKYQSLGELSIFNLPITSVHQQMLLVEQLVRRAYNGISMTGIYQLA